VPALRPFHPAVGSFEFTLIYAGSNAAVARSAADKSAGAKSLRRKCTKKKKKKKEEMPSDEMIFIPRRKLCKIN